MNETETQRVFHEDSAAKEPHVDRAPLITAAYSTPNSILPLVSLNSGPVSYFIPAYSEDLLAKPPT
jgi:hypothetical protein